MAGNSFEASFGTILPHDAARQQQQQSGSGSIWRSDRRTPSLFDQKIGQRSTVFYSPFSNARGLNYSGRGTHSGEARSALITPPREERYAGDSIQNRGYAKQSQGIPGLLPDDDSDVYNVESEASGEDVIASLKLQIEALTTAMVVTDKENEATPDAFELAHHMLSRLKMLKEENERLFRLSSGVELGRLEAEKEVLTRENSELRNELAKLKRKRNTVGTQM